MNRNWFIAKYLFYGMMSLIYGYLTYFGVEGSSAFLPPPSHYGFILIYLTELLIFVFTFTNWLHKKSAAKKIVYVMLAVLFSASFLSNHYRIRGMLIFYATILILMMIFCLLVTANAILDSFFFMVLPFIMIVLQSMEFGYLLADDIKTGNSPSWGNPMIPEMVLTMYLGLTILIFFLGVVMRYTYYEEYKKYVRKGGISFIHFIFIMILAGVMLNEDSRALVLWGMITLAYILAEYMDIMKLVRGKLLKGDGCTLAIECIFGTAMLPFLIQFCGLVNPPQAFLITLMLPIVLYITVGFKYLPQYIVLYFGRYEVIAKDIAFTIWMLICLFLPFFNVYQEQLFWINAHIVAEDITVIVDVAAVPCICTCFFIIVLKMILVKDKGIKARIIDEILGIRNIYMILVIGTSLGIGATALVSRMYQGWDSMINLELNSICFLVLLLLFAFSTLNIFIREFAASMWVEEQAEK